MLNLVEFAGSNVMSPRATLMLNDYVDIRTQVLRAFQHDIIGYGDALNFVLVEMLVAELGDLGDSNPNRRNHIIADVLKQIGIHFTDDELRSFIQRFSDEGFKLISVKADLIALQNCQISMTKAGRRLAEQKLEEFTNFFHTVRKITDDANEILNFDTKYFIPEEIRFEIISKIETLRDVINQSDLDDRQLKNARSVVDAVLILAQAPDPPWEYVVGLLNSKFLTAFLNTAAILTIFHNLGAV